MRMRPAQFVVALFSPQTTSSSALHTSHWVSSYLTQTQLKSGNRSWKLYLRVLSFSMISLDGKPSSACEKTSMKTSVNTSVKPAVNTVAFWEWPNVLSLDAPLIAALWQSLFAHVFGAALGWPYALLLGAAVWLIYSADRWFDGRSLGADARTRRHRFYVRHRRLIFRVWWLVFAGTFTLSVFLLTPAEFAGGAVLGTLMLSYLLRRHRGDQKTHPKELQIAIIFALGVVFLPLLSRALDVSSLSLVFYGGLFGVLIFFNCALIARWEGDLDREVAPFSVRAPKLAARLNLLTLGFALLCAASGLFFGSMRPLFAALALSAFLLYSLGQLSPRLSPAARRVLADAALFTPLLWLLHG